MGKSNKNYIIIGLCVLLLFILFVLFMTGNKLNNLVIKYNDNIEFNKILYSNISYKLEDAQIKYYDTLFENNNLITKYNNLTTEYNLAYRIKEEKEYEYDVLNQNYNVINSMLQDMDYLVYLKNFHKNNDYNLQANNCVHQTLSFEKIVESNGYEFIPIKIGNKTKDGGHMLGYIKVYIDPVSGVAMNYYDFMNIFNDDYYISYEEITSKRKMEEIITVNVNSFGHIR